MIEPVYLGGETAPPDETTLWRYVDLTKLISMLKDKVLHFARPDCLGDEWEAALTRATMDSTRRRFVTESDADRVVAAEIVENSGLDAESESKLAAFLKEEKQVIDRLFTVSCWHMSDRESAAMWKGYADRGIAIRTSLGSLRKSVVKYDLYIGSVVRYIDYDDESIKFQSMIDRLRHKRLSFQSEHEYRLIAVNVGHISLHKADPEFEAPPFTTVKVNLKQLIEAVYVAPSSPEWIVDVVREIMKRFQLKNIPVEHSAMDAKPLF